MIGIRIKSSGRDGRVTRPGFTLIETLVASVVLSIALLGVYSILQYAVKVEGRTALRWNDYAAAAVVVSHMAASLEDAVNVPGLNALIARSGPQGGELICQAGTRRHRYVWHTDDLNDFNMDLQTMIVAGTKNLTTGQPVEEMDQQGTWHQIESSTIAKRLTDLSVQFGDFESGSINWTNSWDGPVGTVIVRIRAQAGEAIVERIVVPMANTELGMGVEE